MKKVIFYKIRSDYGGYSLAEVMTAVTIVIIISSIYLANLKQGDVSVKQNLAAQTIASLIRSVQNDTLAQKVPVGSVLPPAGGWGIYFKSASSSCYIFRDEDGNGMFSLEKDKIDRVAVFGNGQSITDIKIDSPSFASVSEMAIIFLPPNPNVLFSITGVSNGSASTTLMVSGSKTVNINKLGLIDVN